jgi:hypothetical protein
MKKYIEFSFLKMKNLQLVLTFISKKNTRAIKKFSFVERKKIIKSTFSDRIKKEVPILFIYFYILMSLLLSNICIFANNLSLWLFYCKAEIFIISANIIEKHQIQLYRNYLAKSSSNSLFFYF